MLENGKLMPNLDKKSTKALNLTVLQRIDPFVEEILMTAAHVTFYEFNIETNQWSRKDVEGSLFVVKRNSQPRFQFIVMNRRNTDNLVENLFGDFEYEVQGPYLLYRNASEEVNGIWFYNARECEDVANLFSRILDAYSKVAARSKVSPRRSDFEELEAVPTLAVMDGPLEPPTSTASNIKDAPDDPSFLNFFSTAMNNGNTPNSTMSAHPSHSAKVGSTTRPQPIALPTLPIAQALSTLSTSNSIMSTLDNSEANTASKLPADLVKPSSFFAPPPSTSPVIMPLISSSIPTAPLLGPGSLQRPYGAPMLQPFPPPIPPPSLTPTSSPTPNYGFAVSREKVQEALKILIQDNQFIDMVYRAIMNAHQQS